MNLEIRGEFIIIFLTFIFVCSIISMIIIDDTSVKNRTEEQQIYKAMCESMNGVYAYGNNKNLCFKNGNVIEIRK